MIADILMNNPQEEDEKKLEDAINELPILSKKATSVSPAVQRQRDEMIKTVIMMGFNSEAVEYAAAKVEYSSLE